MFAFLAEHRANVFPAGDYADLFAPPGKGRLSVPAAQMAAVLRLQAHGSSGREPAEAVPFDDPDLLMADRTVWVTFSVTTYLRSRAARLDLMAARASALQSGARPGHGHGAGNSGDEAARFTGRPCLKK